MPPGLPALKTPSGSRGPFGVQAPGCRTRGTARGATCFCRYKYNDLWSGITGQPVLLRWQCQSLRGQPSRSMGSRRGISRWTCRLAPAGGSLKGLEGCFSPEGSLIRIIPFQRSKIKTSVGQLNLLFFELKIEMLVCILAGPDRKTGCHPHANIILSHLLMLRPRAAITRFYFLPAG